jgi:hypothetical protein
VAGVSLLARQTVAPDDFSKWQWMKDIIAYLEISFGARCAASTG